MCLVSCAIQFDLCCRATKHHADPNNQLAWCCFITPGNFSCCLADNSVRLIVNHDQRQRSDHMQTCELQTTQSTVQCEASRSWTIVIICRSTVHKREVLSHASSHSFAGSTFTGSDPVGLLLEKRINWLRSGGGRKHTLKYIAEDYFLSTSEIISRNSSPWRKDDYSDRILSLAAPP